MRVHLRALGCRLNEAELETWGQQFRGRGHNLTSNPGQADLVVLNTCAVTVEAARKSRQLARRLKRQNPLARLVLTGCQASLEPQQAQADLPVDLLVSNADKDRLVDLASEALELPGMPRLATEPAAAALFSRGRERAFVKVQDGCRYRCTFCIVTVARGAERSRPLGEVVAEVNALHAAGVQEAVLTGVHVGGYGSDNGSSLLELVTTLLRDTDMPRLRFASVEPWDLPEGMLELFASPRLMPHLHLPLQSGSDAVLRRMARRCRTAEFAALVEGLRAAVPNFNVTTDIIVGFPGETDSEWRETMDFVAAVGFGHLHIFPYSPRPGTHAAGLSRQVDPETRRRRCRELDVLGRRLKRDFLRRQLGCSAPVLWESGTRADSQGRSRHWGYLPNYARVGMPIADHAHVRNRILPVRVLSLSAGDDYLRVALDDPSVVGDQSPSRL